MFSCKRIPKKAVVQDIPPPCIINYNKSDFQTFQLLAKNQNKLILIEFWASWCGPCLRMDRETYSNRSLGNFINENFFVYKLDADSFDGLETAGKYNVESFPALLVLSPQGDLIENIKGFYLPQTLQEILQKHVK